jgi:Flp pilus assembly protein TadG
MRRASRGTAWTGRDGRDTAWTGRGPDGADAVVARDGLREGARAESGQAIVMVALMLTTLLGFTGLVIDIGWFEVNLVRVQRAADAAALAGVVYLPGNPTGGSSAARNEAAKNGYTHGVSGVTVTANPDPGNSKVMMTSVSAPVRTFFSRLFGVTQFTATRRARAEFILPVPMGSPQNYYGINVVCRGTDTPPNCPRVPSADGAGNLAPLGFFGGVEARGTERGNGDAYSTFYNNRPNPNPGFDPNGYSYVVEFGSGTTNGSVWLYDPMFCATGRNTSTQRRLGVGDFWFTSGGVPMTTAYRLYDMNGTPYSVVDDVLLAQQTYVSDGVDKGPLFRGDQNYGGGENGNGEPDCQSTPGHNSWVPLANGLAAGEYRLQVTSSGGTLSEDAINGFGIEATALAGPTPRVYGQSRMEAFIVINNSSVFYLAQVEAAHAGKVLEIKLFDPGDITNTSFRIRIPTSTGFQYATFTWTSTGTSGCAPGGAASGGPTTTLTTSTSSCNYYNNNWVTISAQIPVTYTAPTPPGEPGPGWWKIEYGTLGTGQDITTWEVNIRGNPVHLVIP